MALRPAHLLATLGLALPLFAQQFPTHWRLESPSLVAYFDSQVRQIESATLADIRSPDDWSARREERRREFLDMLGLWPLPERTDLKPVVTGRVEADAFTVERLHFQSLPGLYVTANLYLPRAATGAVPAILYVCGHAEVKTNGVSHGNKTAYQHHGAWFARNGYACLTLDTLQLGEIQGDHHGTYRLGQWWWNSRGYTPAGVEAWNSVRAVDYLVSRPEIDATRIGMTGRSGGGSYTWTTAAIDDRIRAAAPVAGITDLRNHVCDGAVEGHCDCMFFINTRRWDFALNAALIAPRPLLVVNTDADSIFPLDGVVRTFEKARRIYALHDAYDRIGLVIGPGPHTDSQNLQLPVLRWFNQHLRDVQPPVTNAATREFPTASLRVFESLPADARNTTAQEFFGPAPTPAPDSPDALRTALRSHVFAGWPASADSAVATESASARDGSLRLRVLDFESQQHVPLRLFVLDRPDDSVASVRLTVADHAAWPAWLASARARFPEAFRGTPFADPGAPAAGLANPPPDTALVWFWPRGSGPSVWPGDARKQTQIRRRFQLLGQTLDGMRTWDILRAVGQTRTIAPPTATLTLHASGNPADLALHAALFEPKPLTLELDALADTWRRGPDYLNIARHTTPAELRRHVGQHHRLILRD